MPSDSRGAVIRIGRRAAHTIASRLSPSRGDALLAMARAAGALLVGRQLRQAVPGGLDAFAQRGELCLIGGARSRIQLPQQGLVLFSQRASAFLFGE